MRDLAGEAAPPRDDLTSTPSGTCVMSLYHPEMQEVLLREPAKEGAEVWCGAAMAAVYPGKRERTTRKRRDSIREVTRVRFLP